MTCAGEPTFERVLPKVMCVRIRAKLKLLGNTFVEFVASAVTNRAATLFPQNIYFVIKSLLFLVSLIQQIKSICDKTLMPIGMTIFK